MAQPSQGASAPNFFLSSWFFFDTICLKQRFAQKSFFTSTQTRLVALRKLTRLDVKKVLEGKNAK